MKKKKIIIIGLSLTAILLFAVVYIAFLKSDKIGDEFKIESVIKGNIEKSLEANGEVRSQKISSSYGDGMRKIESVNVKAGDSVKKGDVLLTFESDTDLQIEKTNKELSALEATYQGILKGSSYETIHGIELQIKGAQNNLSLAESEFAKTKTLYNEGLISGSEYRAAENNVFQLKNQLEILKNQYNQAAKGVSSDVKQQYTSQIESLKVSLQILEKAKERDIVKAEFDGIVTELNATAGNTPLAGRLVAEVQDPGMLAVYTDFLVDEAVLVKANMSAVVENEDMELSLKDLKVSQVYPKAEAKLSDLGIEQKRVTIRIDLPGNLNNLVIGTSVDVTIRTESKENVLIVPKSAAYDKDEKKYVTALENGKQVEKEVTLGIENDDFSEIVSGLKEGERVLVKK